MTIGSVLQGAIGFASGLMGVPMLVLCGFSLIEATVINFISTTVQNFTGAIQLREHIEAQDVTWPAILRCVGLPLGTLALAATPDLDQNLVKQIIGVVLLVSVLALVSLRVTPRERLGFGWVGLTFISSGFLMGFASIGGAPRVVYVNSLTWSAARSRAFVFFGAAASMPRIAAAWVWPFGAAVLRPAFLAGPVLICLAPILSPATAFAGRLSGALRTTNTELREFIQGDAATLIMLLGFLASAFVFATERQGFGWMCSIFAIGIVMKNIAWLLDMATDLSGGLS